MTVGIVYWPMSHSNLPLEAGRADVVERLHDPVDHAVVPGLLGAEPPVPVTVPGDGLLALAGVLGEDALDGLLHELVVLGLDRDVGGGPADARGRLVHHDARVWQGHALALRAHGEQELPH